MEAIYASLSGSTSWRHATDQGNRVGDTACAIGAADVPVIMQRFSLSPESVDIPVRTETGTFSAWVWRRSRVFCPF